MQDSLYKAFLTSVLRTLLKMVGGALVARGLVEDGLMQEVAAGLAIVVVTAVWDFWRIYHRVLYQKWLVVLGLNEMPGAMTAEEVEVKAKEMVREGYRP